MADQTVTRAETPVAPPPAGAVDIERFSKNVARMVEEGGKALAAYLKPREDGTVKAEPADEIADVVKTLGHVAEYWLSDPQRAVEVQANLGKAYLDLWASAVHRMAGEAAAPVIAPDPRDKRFADPEWSSNQFYDFMKQAYLLTTQWADQLVRNADLDQHTRQKAEFYVRQIGNAISPSNFVLTNPELMRETLNENAENLVRGMHMLAEDIEAGQGSLKIRQSDASKFAVGKNLALTPGKVIYQNELMQLIQYSPDDRERAEAAAADHSALDQQVLHPRSQSGKILHPVVRRTRSHRVRDLVGQSRRAPRGEKLRGLHARGAARRARRHQGGDRRGRGERDRLLRGRHVDGGHARLDGGQGRQTHRQRNVLRRAGRFHPCGRSHGVRRRGPAQDAREEHGRARLPRRQEDGERLQHAALERSDLAVRDQQLSQGQAALPVRPALLEFGFDAHAGGEPHVLPAQLLSGEQALQGPDGDRQREARSRRRHHPGL